MMVSSDFPLNCSSHGYSCFNENEVEIVHKFTMTLIAVVLSVTLAGCATPPPMQQRVGQQEEMLSAAGFNVRPADTSRKLTHLQKLPPYQILMRFRDERPIYLYADPQYCRCLYVGNERAYQTYRRFAVERNIANEQYAATRMNEDAAMDWDVWGPAW